MNMKSLILFITLSLFAVISNAQQFPDRHSTSYTDAWLSCVPSANPHIERGNSHWIRYDLGSTYMLSNIQLWNYNDPLNLNNGVNEMVIDVSSDGINWTEVGIATVNVSQGSAFYEGEDIIDLGGVAANYLLITVLSNHGGSCYGFSEIKVTSAVVLPVELASQDARCTPEGDAVMVSWQTMSEVGNDHFTIQKKDDSKEWQDLTDVTAKGVDGKGAAYNYLDREISGNHYYRLVNTDVDGRVQYFDVMSAGCNGSSEMSMSVVNPFTENLVISYRPLSSGGDITYTVETLDGKNVFSTTTTAQSNSITIPSSEWTTGTYIITIQQDGQYIAEKVVKI